MVHLYLDAMIAGDLWQQDCLPEEELDCNILTRALHLTLVALLTRCTGGCIQVALRL